MEQYDRDFKSFVSTNTIPLTDMHNWYETDQTTKTNERYINAYAKQHGYVFSGDSFVDMQTTRQYTTIWTLIHAIEQIDINQDPHTILTLKNLLDNIHKIITEQEDNPMEIESFQRMFTLLQKIQQEIHTIIFEQTTYQELKNNPTKILTLSSVHNQLLQTNNNLVRRMFRGKDAEIIYYTIPQDYIQIVKKAIETYSPEEIWPRDNWGLLEVRRKLSALSGKYTTYTAYAQVVQEDREDELISESKKQQLLEETKTFLPSIDPSVNIDYGLDRSLAQINDQSQKATLLQKAIAYHPDISLKKVESYLPWLSNNHTYKLLVQYILQGKGEQLNKNFLVRCKTAWYLNDDDIYNLLRLDALSHDTPVFTRIFVDKILDESFRKKYNHDIPITDQQWRLLFTLLKKRIENGLMLDGLFDRNDFWMIWNWSKYCDEATYLFFVRCDASIRWKSNDDVHQKLNDIIECTNHTDNGLFLAYQLFFNHVLWIHIPNTLDKKKLLNFFASLRSKNIIWKGKTLLIGDNNYAQWYELFGQDTMQKLTDYLLVWSSTLYSERLNRRFDELYNIEHNSLEETKNELQNWLESVSSELILSTLGNQAINLNTTTEVMIEELIKRHGTITHAYEYARSKSLYLSSSTITFVQGQCLVGLLANGKHDLFNELLQKHNIEVLARIDQIINYKTDNNPFTLESYLGLMIWLKKALQDNPALAKHLYATYCKPTPSPQEIFKQTIQIGLGMDGKYLGENGVCDIPTPISLDNPYGSYIKKYACNLDLLRIGKKKDILMLYKGSWDGWWLERLPTEIESFISFGYTTLYTNERLTIQEKDGIRMFFINYDAYLWDQINILHDIQNILRSENVKDKERNTFPPIYPILVGFRGHNHATREMIQSVCKNGEWFGKTKAILLDGWCDNINALSGYRERGIPNQIIAYDGTGKGHATFAFVTSFITEILRNNTLTNPQGPPIISWERVLDTMLWPIDHPRDNSENNAYARKHFRAPWSFVDIVIDMEKQQQTTRQ